MFRIFRFYRNNSLVSPSFEIVVFANRFVSAIVNRGPVQLKKKQKKNGKPLKICKYNSKF